MIAPDRAGPLVYLFDRMANGDVRLLARKVDLAMDLGRWYHVELIVEVSEDTATVTATLDDGHAPQGPVALTLPLEEAVHQGGTGLTAADFCYLELTMQENTCWFDNVCVEPLGEARRRAPRPKPRAMPKAIPLPSFTGPPVLPPSPPDALEPIAAPSKGVRAPT